MDTPTTTIAKRVDAARKEQGVAILPLSEATGIPYTTLHRMLTGKSEFRISDLFSIAHELNADAASWITNLPAPKPAQAAA